MSRKIHYISGNKGEAAPQQVVVVDAAGELVEDAVNPRVRNEYFQGGYCIRWKHRNDRPVLNEEVAFLDERNFWDMLKRITPYGTLTWVVGRRLSRTLT